MTDRKRSKSAGRARPEQSAARRSAPAEQTTVDAPGMPPKVRRVTVENFKCFPKFEVDLADFNVLIGSNNSGKSTVLEAIYLADNFLRLTTRLTPAGELRTDSRARQRFEFFPLPRPADLWHNRITFQRYVFITVEYDNGVYFTFRLSLQYGTITVRLIDYSKDVTPAQFAVLTDHPVAYVPSFAGTVVREPYVTPRRREAMTSEGHYGEILRNILLEIANSAPDKFNRLERLVESHFGIPRLRTSFDPRKDEYVVAQYDHGKTKLDIFSCGAGVLQFIQILAYVFLRQSATVLIDEPDAHLHSTLQRQVVDLLHELASAEGLQVVLATHSKEIINYLPPQVIIEIDPTRSAGVRLDSYLAVMDALKRVGGVDNLDAALLLKYRRALFVEGGDRAVLEEFAKKCGSRAFSGPRPVTVIATKGATNPAAFNGLTAFEALVGEKIHAVWLRDRDYLMSEEISQLQSKAHDAPLRLHILARKELENYLLEPRAVARAVNARLKERGSKASVDEGWCRVAIEAACDETRDDVEGQVMDSFERTDRKAAPSTLRARAREWMKEHWATFEDKVANAPGDEVMRRLRQYISEQHAGVSFGDVALAQSFDPAEVPDELKAFFALLESA